jgi:hypothetical protein
MLARTCASEAAACAGCGMVSRRVHSSYQRRLADTASGGQEVLIDLQTVSVLHYSVPQLTTNRLTEDARSLPTSYLHVPLLAAPARRA